jgi:Zn-dependent metalloprotease
MKRVMALAAVVAMALLIFPGIQAQRRVFTTGTAGELDLARSWSVAHVRGKARQRGIERPEDLEVASVKVDELSMAHTRIRQSLRGIPVFGGEAIVHLRSDGELFAETDNLIPNLNVVDTRPRLAGPAAIARALADYGCSDCLTAPPLADLMVLRQEGADHLVYRVRMRREDGTPQTALPVTFIDAHSGEVVLRYDDLQTGTGTSLYSGTVAIGTSYNASAARYYMENLARKVGTFDMRNDTATTYRFSDANDLWDATSHKAGVAAHHAAERFLDYLLNVHGRNGLDGNGGPGHFIAHDGVTALISSRVHYGTNYNNAFWNGSLMTYGDGDGTTFSPLVTLDVAGHEMMHGVTQFTAALTYSGESGALNESWSDVFGAMTERYVRGETTTTWSIGEEAYTPSVAGDALRHMDDPHRAANSGFAPDDDPDHYSERYTGSADNGGVHINSGIANKAFYLLAKGGAHHLGGSMQGIGADAAARIWFKALTTYMTSSTNFAGARTATINAAGALYGTGSVQQSAVATAWCLVGVGECTGPPPPPAAELIVNGGFEGTSSPWVPNGSAFYTGNGSAPHSGTGYVYLGAGDSRTGNVYQTITVPPSGNPQLTFWLNVTSSETTTTSQYDRLFIQVRDTAGMLLRTLATYSNLNKGATGVYTEKGAFDLSGFRGQTIRIHFRATTDVTLPTTFRVDDVSVR